MKSFRAHLTTKQQPQNLAVNRSTATKLMLSINKFKETVFKSLVKNICKDNHHGYWEEEELLAYFEGKPATEIAKTSKCSVRIVRDAINTFQEYVLEMVQALPQSQTGMDDMVEYAKASKRASDLVATYLGTDCGMNEYVRMYLRKVLQAEVTVTYDDDYIYATFKAIIGDTTIHTLHTSIIDDYHLKRLEMEEYVLLLECLPYYCKSAKSDTKDETIL